MSRVRVRFEPEGETTEGEAGALLLDLAAKAGSPVRSDCGGRGICRSCRVEVRSGRIRRLDQDGAEETVAAACEVLACQTAALTDLVVYVPPEVRLCPTGEEVAGYLGPGAAALLRPPARGFPLAERLALRLPPPSFDDPTPDWERLQRALREHLGQERPLVCDLGLLRRLPDGLRAHDFALSATVVDEGERHRVIDLGRVGGREVLGLAVDIGTTTVRAELVDLTTGQVRGGAAEFNAQARYGEDVISRIIWTQEHAGGAEDLRRAVVGTINGLVQRLLGQVEARREQIVAVSVAGNATMICLLLRLPADTIRRAPHVPPVGRPPYLSAAPLGLLAHPEAAVFCLPAINGYVGGDITGGILASDLAQRDELSLFIDVGTNGEVVLGNREWMICCSCSAGPAFEGMGIEAGLPARPGAIESLVYDRSSDTVQVRTVAGEPPVGLCGNGLVTALASLLEAQVIDRVGQLMSDYPSPRMRQVEGEWQFVLLWAEETGIGRDLVLRQSEIDNLIRAKAAVYAAVSTLLEALGLTGEQIERLYLAGAFGSHLDVAAAIKIGLLPDLPPERVTVAGNTALMGAYLALLSSTARRQLGEFAQATTYLDLSSVPRFMEEFVAALMLPHTELERFPSVVARGSPGVVP